MDIIEKIKSGDIKEIELLEYVTDNDINIAIAAAESELATEPILDIAAHDKDREVRLAAVRNPNMGIDTLKMLSKDNDFEISQIAKARLERA